VRATRWRPTPAGGSGPGRCAWARVARRTCPRRSEVTLDLARRFPEAEVDLITRAPGLALKDTSPFSEEGYFPEFVDYYHRASRSSKRMLDGYMRRTNYSSVDEDILHRLYVLVYEQGLDGPPRVRLRTNRCAVELRPTAEAVRLVVQEVHLQHTEPLDVDLVVAATGYRDLGPEPHQEPYPPLLAGIIDRFAMDEGYLRVNADYTLASHEPGTPPLVLNGLCESSHGIGDAGSFSLLALRAQTIVDGLRARGVLGEARSREP
jgi:L-ornithine N5-oxygenase